MKINLQNPPDWLINGDFESLQIRYATFGSSLVPVCNKCGEVLVVKNDDGSFSFWENCPMCFLDDFTKDLPSLDN